MLRQIEQHEQKVLHVQCIVKQEGPNKPQGCSPSVNRSFFVGGCCGTAGGTGGWPAAPEGRGGFALGSGAALLAVGLLGEAALLGAGCGGAGRTPALLLELHVRSTPITLLPSALDDYL